MKLCIARMVAVTGLALAASGAVAQVDHSGHSHAMPAVKAPLPPESIPADAPRITFEKNSHDFGVITDDNNVTTTFKFTNSGKTTLKIGTLSGSCGCTVPQLEKKDYEPGEGGEISVTYNPHNRRGKQQTNVTVNSNDPAAPAVQLQVHSEIKPMMFLEPMAVNLGSVPKGKGATSTVKISSRNAELKPTQASCSNPNIKAEIRTDSMKEEVVGEDKIYTYLMDVTLAPTAEMGNVIGQVTVRTTESARLLTLSVNGEVVGDYNMMPKQVQMYNIQPGGPLNSVVRVSSRSNRAFKILSAEEQPMGTKTFSNITFAEVPGATPQTWQITLTGKAPEMQSAFRGKIVVTTDAEGEDKVFEVPYNGFATNPQPSPQARFNNPTGAPVDPWVANPSSLVR